MRHWRFLNEVNKIIGYRQNAPRCKPHRFDSVRPLRFSATVRQEKSIANVKLNELPAFLSKITYNDVLWKIIKSGEKRQKVVDKNFQGEPQSICVQFLSEDANSKQSSEINPGCDDVEKANISHQNPGIIEKVIIKESGTSNIENVLPKDVINFTPVDIESTTSPVDWSSKNIIDTETNLINDNIDDVVRFGTADPSIPRSDVPCGGCGALLQCRDHAEPGFLPKQIFLTLSKHRLKSEICQRCHFLNEFNLALGVNVSPKEYPKILSHIKQKHALVILMVDLMDFPCSIWPGIMDLIGLKPVIVVGNKIDLFVQENTIFEAQIKNSLINALEERDVNLEHLLDVKLISAKTGYGVESLVTSIHKNWNNAGDIYLIGNTNVGKSTLFNILIKSDICRVEADKVLKRATVSTWPGTTLNLLKFPMKKVYGELLFRRGKRLYQESQLKSLTNKLNKGKRYSLLEQKTLKGFVTRTSRTDESPEIGNEFRLGSMRTETFKNPGIDPKDHRFQFCRWFHDTPGVVHEDQIINLLTASELALTVPDELIKPRIFKLSPGSTLFLAGLARVDFYAGAKSAWFTVFASNKLPVTITSIENADTVYSSLLGSNLFRVPSGDQERLSKWPKLKSKNLMVVGKIYKEAAGDVVLSSAGWISIAVEPAMYCKLTVWTPEGKGIHLRELPVVKKGYLFKGSAIRNTPAYAIGVKEVEKEKISPPVRSSRPKLLSRN